MPAGLKHESASSGTKSRIGPFRLIPLHPASIPPLLHLAILALIAIGARASSANELTYTFALSKDTVILSNEPGVVRVEIRDDGYRSPLEEGVPDLPFKIVTILLPQGHEVAHFEFESSSPVLLRENTRVRPVPPVLTGDGTRAADGLKFGSRSGDDSAAVEGSYLGTGYLDGYALASFAIRPLQAEGGNVVVRERIDLRITTREAADPRHISVRKRLVSRRDEMNAGVVSSLVLNPDMLGRYVFDRTSDHAASRAFRPTEAPSLEGSPVEYLIVTGEALSAEYQRLADWKTRKGIRTVVRTTEWIQNNCRQGVDLAETIRFFLRDAFELWGTRWVLLGGDTDVIPARYAYSTYLNGQVNYVAADLYFACLDGSWNADHDAKWGEVNVDDTDLYAELYVGRLPTASVSDAAVMIDKIMTYESAADRGYTDRVSLLAEVLFPADWNEGESIALNGAELSESLYVSTFLGRPLQVTRSYESYNLYAGSVPLTRQATIDSMNAGPGIVNHIGHGYRFNISCGDVSLVTTDADALTNGDRLFTLFMVDCNVSQFDYSCLAEHFMRNPDGGAVATIGASHKEFPIVDSYYMNDFYRLVFEDRAVRIGEAFARSRLSQTPWAESGNNSDLWTHYVYTLLADPELGVWTGAVDSTVVSHAASVGLGANSIAVGVSAGGGPPDSAVVCLYKSGEDFQTAATDASGNVTIDFTSESPGSISVVVTGYKMTRHQSYITVTPSSPAYLCYAGAVVDDDTVGGTFGNGDGVVDAGETIDLWVSVANTGGSWSGAVSLEVDCGDTVVSVVDSTASLGAVGPGSTATAQDPVRVVFDGGVPDRTQVTFTATLADGAAGPWVDSFHHVVHAPALALVGLRIDDGGPPGDGDGVNEDGEPFLLFYGIKNYGTGVAAGLSARIADLESAFVFFDSTDAYPDLQPFAGGENVAGFHLLETETTVEHLLLVEIDDLFGRTFRDSIELRPPGPPSSLVLDPGYGVDRIEVSWYRSVALDVSTYNVYRSLAAGGPYERSNVDPVEHTVFMDTGLLANTRYYYVVTALDGSGNESAYSAESSGSTNPPQAPGWPLELAVSTTSSPAVGDIDGDGDKEIVVGNQYVCALHHDGTELHDGDNEPETLGPLSTDGDVFTAAIALARLDARPGLDIIAADFNTHSVYCMGYDGELLPGWPQAAEPSPPLGQPNGFRAAPVAGDLDGDGIFEIVAVDVKGVIYAWKVDGSEFADGDGDSSTTGVLFRTPATDHHYQTPALCDLDGDGKDEIVVGTRADTLYALNADGSAVPGWPFALTGEAVGSVAVGDVDADGDPEVVCHQREGGLVYVLHHDGTVAAGWPRWVVIAEPYFCPSPALADFEGDGPLEVVVAGYNLTETRLYIFKANGQSYPGWPVQFNTGMATECSPVVADVDGDGSPDVVIGDESRFVYAFDIAGEMLAGFPIPTSDAVRATPYLDDLDGDGDIDMVLSGWDKNLYVWDLPGAYDEDLAPWPTFRANVHRNGVGSFDVPSGSADPTRVPEARPTLAQNYPNPFATTTTISFHLGLEASGAVSLRVYDVTGALVTTLVDEPLPPGRHHVVWDGSDGRGKRVATGLYFYQLRCRDFASTKKLLLIR
jgi:chitodextrinase